MSYEEVLENIRKRDKIDKEKEYGALKVAPGAHVIDSTNMSIKQVEKEISKLIDKKLKDKKKEAKIYRIRPETPWKKFVRTVVKGILYGFYRIVFRIEKINEENLPLDESTIVCANHLNIWDAVGLVVSSKRRIIFIAKECYESTNNLKEKKNNKNRYNEDNDEEYINSKYEEPKEENNILEDLYKIKNSEKELSIEKNGNNTEGNSNNNIQKEEQKEIENNNEKIENTEEKMDEFFSRNTRIEFSEGRTRRKHGKGKHS